MEYYGGFPNLHLQGNETFRSSLAVNGTVTTATVPAKAIEITDLSTKVSLSVSFPAVDWNFLQAVYGWSALQWQAWARGEFTVTSDVPVHAVLYTDHVLEFALDGVRHFGGDFYAFRKSPLVVSLTPGRHVLDLRLVRDVRAMGGIGEPTVDFDVEIRFAGGDLEVGDGKVLLSDVIDGLLPSPCATVDVRNSGQDRIEVVDIRSSLHQVSHALHIFATQL